MSNQLDRTVLSDGKTNFRTHELVFPQPGVVTFARPRKMKLALAIVAAVAAFVLVVGFRFVVRVVTSELLGKTAAIVFAIVFVLVELISTAGAIAVIYVRFRSWPLVFDKNQGRMWRNGKPDPVIGDYAPLTAVEALQVCSAKVSDSESVPFQVYELNVVMKRPAGTRVPALCHGDRDALFADANKLAEFLGVPLLDHTEEFPMGKRPSRA